MVAPWIKRRRVAAENVLKEAAVAIDTAAAEASVQAALAVAAEEAAVAAAEDLATKEAAETKVSAKRRSRKSVKEE